MMSEGPGICAINTHAWQPTVALVETPKTTEPTAQQAPSQDPPQP